MSFVQYHSGVICTGVAALILLAGCFGGSSPTTSDDGPVAEEAAVVSLAESDNDPLGVTAIAFESTPHGLHVTFEVDSLEEATFKADFHWALAKLCWSGSAAAANESRPATADFCTFVEMDVYGDVVDTMAFLDREDEACNSWMWCNWAVPYTLAWGSPGSIGVQLPWSLLEAEPGQVMQGDLAYQPLVRTKDPQGPVPNGPAGVYAYANPPVIGPTSVVVPSAYAGQNVVHDEFFSAPPLKVPDTFDPMVASEAVLKDGRGENDMYGGVNSAEFDILGVSFERDGDSVIVIMEMAEVTQATGIDFNSFGWIGFDESEVAMYAFRATGGQVTQYTDYVCPAPSRDACTLLGYPGYDVEFVLGTPGSVRIAMDEAMFGEIKPHARLTTGWFDAMGAWVYGYTPSPVPVRASAGAGSTYFDYVWGVPPVALDAAA